MAKVFSWKVAPGKYAYLEPEDGSYIRSRITDSTAIQQMASRVESWSEDEYREAFDNMKAEVNRVYGSITGSYSDYYSAGGIGGGTVVLLAGKDGTDGKTSVVNQYISETDYTELINKMDEEFERYKADILAQVESIKNSLENTAADDIGAAMDSLRETRAELENLRERLGEASSKAQDAIDAVRGLSMFADGEIDPQILEDILLLESRFNEWAIEYDGKLAALLVDYDSVTQQLGSIAVAMSAYEGQLSMMFENINAVSGTVGTVEQTWAANSGMMRTLATWYNESAGTYAEVCRVIDASRAAIEDIVNFYNSGTTSALREYIDGSLAEMGRTIETMGESITSGNQSVVRIEERLNGLSGIVSTNISRYDSLSGRVVTINDTMDALDGRITTSMTVANDALQSARDMRDVWCQESGMIRSVTDLIIEVDEFGDPIYYYIDPDLPDHGDQSQWVRVYLIGTDPVTGLPIYNTQKDGSGTQYTDHVVPSYQAKMMSYILQNSNEIDMTVLSGDVMSALRLSVTDSGSLIYMTADRVVIDSDIIANSLTAKAANVGGVHLGEGMISAQTGANKWALRSDGVLEATGAKVNGAITATSLMLGGGSSIEDYVTDRIQSVSGLDETMVNGLISGYVTSQNFLKQDALDGYVDAEALAEWLAQQSGLTSAYVQTIVNAMSGAQINSAWTESNGSGGTRHVIRIGNEDYSWDTWDAGDFLLLNTEYSGETESGTARFLISKNGLLEANNAVIYGQVYANSGWFRGSVSADSGYFRGSVSANNGYFSGSVYATSLTLGGGDTIEEYVDGRLESVSGMDRTAVENVVRDYVSSQNFLSGSVLDGYVSAEELADWLAQQSGLTSAYVNTIVNAFSGAQINSAWTENNGSGGTRHVIRIGNQDFSWDTWDAGDFILLDTEYSGETESGTAKFLVSKNGLLQANNAIIYGQVYANSGWFKGSVSADSGYFRGSVSANNGYFSGSVYATNGVFQNVSATNSYFQGDIVANSLKLGNNETIQQYVDGKIASAVTSGMDAETVNQLINDYLIASGITMDGYMSLSGFSGWVEQWLIDHPDYELDEGAVSAIVRSELSKVFTETTSGGVTTHTAVIGDRTYTWKTVDTGDYLLINTGIGDTSDSSTTGFIVSREGLLEAHNAVIYGKVYASEGYFKGSVSADNSYFRGSVSATNGYFSGTVYATNGVFQNVSATNSYFQGDIVANSLKLGGNQTIQQYVDGKIASAVTSGMDAETVNQLINNYLTESGITMDGYLAESAFTAWAEQWNADHPDYQLDEGAVSAIAQSVLSHVFSSTSSGGVTTHTAVVGENTYTWKTVDTGEYLLIDTGIGETNSGGTGFIVSKNGLLEAYNAVVYGTVYASDGRFKGQVMADSGYFKGSISADSGYFSGSVYATNGKFEHVSATDSYFKGEIVADSLKLGSNAVVSGTVHATSGKFENISATNMTISNSHFSGNVYANNGYFKGHITADSLTLGGVEYDSMPDIPTESDINGLINSAAETNGWITSGDGYYKIGNPVSDGSSSFTVTTGGLLKAKNAIISGSVFATNGVFNGKVYAKEGEFSGTVKATSGKFENVTATNFSATNSYFKGKIEADSGSFKGTVSATNGYFKGTICANTGYFKGSISADSLTLGSNAVVSGAVYATKGRFENMSAKTITAQNFSATNSYFKGKIEADSGSFKGTVSATNGYFKGTVCANTGYFKGSISANSLALLSNASVSGAVYATKGKFENMSAKTVTATNFSATNSYFSGEIVADSLKLGNSAVVSGAVYATRGKFENMSATSINATNFSATNSYFKGKIEADSGSFKGTVSATSGYFKGSISADSLTLGSNAVVSGAVYATKGKFEKISATTMTATNFSATNSYFSGKVYASEGNFNGNITANSLTLGGIEYTSMPSAQTIDVTEFVRLGEAVGDENEVDEPSTVIYSTGSLVARNAVISGNVYANNGYFKGTVHATDGDFKGSISATSGSFRGRIEATDGYFNGTISAATIEASDIVLGGQALKFSTGNNTFLIQDGNISVDYIADVPTLQGITVYSNTYSTSAATTKSTSFTTTGDTTLVIPAVYVSSTGQSQMIGQGSYPSTALGITCRYFLTSATTAGWIPGVTPMPSTIRGNSDRELLNMQNNSPLAYKNFYVGLATGTTAQTSVTLKGGVQYHLICDLKIEYPSDGTISVTGKTSQVQFVNQPTITDTQFFRIGRNGMQCFMPGGYSFTAADRGGTEGPIISLIGSASTCGIRIDSSGIKIKRRASEAWRDIAIE